MFITHGGTLGRDLFILGLHLDTFGRYFCLVVEALGLDRGPLLRPSGKGSRKVRQITETGSWNGCMFKGIRIFLKNEQCVSTLRERIDVQATISVRCVPPLALFLFRKSFCGFEIHLVELKKRSALEAGSPQMSVIGAHSQSSL